MHLAALTQSFTFRIRADSKLRTPLAWYGMCVSSVPPGFRRAVFFVTLKNAASSAIVIVALRCPRNSRSTTSGTVLGTPFPYARCESRGS
jgi:hypothetical protein